MKLSNALLLAVALMFLSSCGDGTEKGRLTSSSIELKAERIRLLYKHVTCFSEITDAEFDLFNVNGFGNDRASIPGASSWNYKFAVKIDTGNVAKWIDGMVEISAEDYDGSWVKEITKVRSSSWMVHSTPQCYSRPEDDVKMYVFRTQGIIFKRVLNL